MIVCGKSSATLQLFYKILQDGKEPSAILSDLLEHFRSIMICKVNPNAPELSAYGNKISVIQKDAQELSDAYLDALFDSLHHSFSEANRSSSPRMSAEMGLLRLCRLRGSQALDSLEERITALEKKRICTYEKQHAPANRNYTRCSVTRHTAPNDFYTSRHTYSTYPRPCGKYNHLPGFSKGSGTAPSC